ncbi:MAG: PAS domain S-box protein [Armatimonadetes bacterium]|nr:PAS domain S-box protein [Armatimonadota bacterium]
MRTERDPIGAPLRRTAHRRGSLTSPGEPLDHHTAALERRLAFERTLLKASARFVNPSSFGEAVRGALEDIGRLTDAAAAFLCTANGTGLHATDIWCRDDPAGRPGLQPLLPWLLERLALDTVVAVPDSAADRELLRSCGIRSLLLLPIPRRGAPGGLIGLQDPSPELEPSDLDLAVLRLLADTVGNALERERDAEALRASEARYRALVELSPDALVVVADGVLRFANQAAAELLGAADAAAVEGRPVGELLQVGEAGRAAGFLGRIARRGHATQVGELRVVRLDGQPLDIEVAGAPFDDEGQPAVLIVARNLTARKHAERSLRLSALGQLAQGVAHDFNNFLQGILHATELAARHTSDPSVLANLATAQQAAHDGAAAARRIQEFGRRQADRPETQVDDLAVIARDALQITRLHWQRPDDGAPRVTVRDDLAPAGPVRGVAAELCEVVVNILINAVQAMPAGGRLTVRSGTAAGTAWIAVKDTGTGMTQAVAERIFDPYFSTKGDAGVGVGLAMAHAIVRRHAGEIRVETEPGRGSTFTVRVPVAEGLVSAAQPPGPVPVLVRRILVVDDEPTVRDVLAQSLQTLGCEVAAAGTVAEARALCRAAPPDLVVTDYVLPGESGVDLAIAEVCGEAGRNRPPA